MAYLTEAEFRTPTWYTRGFTLTPAEAPGDEVTAAIAELSRQFDRWTRDHFEAENALEVTVDVRNVTWKLYLPKRLRTLTTVETVDDDGVETVETNTDYRVHSSLDAAGTWFHPENSEDFLEILGEHYLVGSTQYWPIGPSTVKVTGNWSWATCPDLVKQAVAMLVWDRFRAKGDDLYRANTWATDQAAYTREPITPYRPSGLPVVNDIIEQFRRDVSVAVG